MRIATLQFSPKLGRVEENIARADSLLSSSSSSLHNLDLLVLPELAFTGYNHPSLKSITPYLEATASGPSTQWAIRTAHRLQCLVTVGYPELYSPFPPTPHALKPTMINLGPEKERYYTLTAYNSTVTVDPRGETVAHYRKTNLWYADEIWAQEGPEGFTTHDLEFPAPSVDNYDNNMDISHPVTAKDNGTPPTEPTRRKTTFAICMDLNPHHFSSPTPTSPPSLPHHVLTTDSTLLILSTAWLTNLPPSSLSASPEEPDADTLSYWFERLGPLIRSTRETICVFANRCGEEPGMKVINMNMNRDQGAGARYAGSSWVGKVGRGKVVLGSVMGRGEEGVGVVDTDGRGWEVLNLEGEEGSE
ncbi:MAG: hypothetical protein LQ343_000245 [Gyalolechia ehrenbergii]|nr:MAG: hypothetical protein LQ343_000245 [Gyalolechia ehrenbergii]